MDPTQRKLMQRDAGTPVAEPRPSVGALLAGAVVLLAGGIALLSLSHASVADVGGAMLVLIGLAMGAGSVWTSSREE